ncbi:GNAT family N-acetyltransferase [Tissierella sp. MSJ-40]|uniref:GNAT family N-acetyltransferase n=1 Tax=Tissierella simiarum TaxID=2841534 RepID=A0ABS6E7R4_9FIRM|nr:aminoglycoside 6'-N-acetyltransferase [Tissierella simiarum]MBU5438475.1 GNAT family N-acetyltransferase [Tissierella simiarum]
MITKIISANKDNLNELVTMALDLWSDNTFEGLETEMLDLIDVNKDILLMSITDENTSGFIYMSVRTDYVEGSDSSPVAYIEGIYVKPEFRNKGIARLLFKAGENWAKANGCIQIGSDIEWDNNVSYDFHRKIGFEEVNRIICFIKDIK